MVASRLNAIGEVLSDDTALLVPPGDGPALAEALARLARSPELRERLSARGRERAEDDFSLERFGLAAASLFETVVRA